MRLVANKACCTRCGTTVESRSRHATQTCGCGNLTVDGGLCYTRRLYRDGEDTWIELSEYGEDLTPNIGMC